MSSTTVSRSLIGVLGVLVAVECTSGQPPVRLTQVDRLQQLETQLTGRFEREHADAVQWARQRGVQLRQEHPDGRITALMFLRDNRPYSYTTLNIDAAAAVSTDLLWPGGTSGLDLSGAGVVLHEWDGGEVRVSHVELIGAVTWADDTSPGYSSHATHVSGTLVALGVDPGARGMANGATVEAYDWSNDDAEMAAAAAAGARVSNHSYGWIRGWHWSGDWYWYGDSTISQTEDAEFGFYDSTAQSWDNIAYNAPFYLICKSAGNDRGNFGNAGHWVWSAGVGWQWSTQARNPDGGATGYDSIGQQGCAKNILTVGAVQDVGGGYTSPSSVVMTSFSGWGPTDDGRIKPDVVANGVGLRSPVATSDVSYSSYSGTSMASPNVAGSLALLIQHYRATHGSADMRAATLKSLLIHTADESGASPGPDYSYGWGLVNAVSAARQISLDESLPEAVQELSLSQAQVFQSTMSHNGIGPIKATICWTDPAGNPVPLSLDPPNPMLVNDLDLRVIGPGGRVYEPWVLDPANPAQPAVRGDNFRDNVESVLIDAPVAGNYTLQVSHKGTIVDGPQDFALILTGLEPAGPVATAFIQWRNMVTGQAFVWMLNGTQVTDSGSLGIVGPDWVIAGVGDFDGDGSYDSLWRNEVTGQTYVWLLNGTQVSETGSVGIVDLDWTIAGTGDFDGDGRHDVLWRNEVTGQTLVWLLDGTQVIGQGSVGFVDLDWVIAGTGDSSGDGRCDIQWRHVPTGQTYVWLLNGTQIIGGGSPGLVNPDWVIASTGDFNGDGRCDLLWRHQVTGHTYIWLLNGAQVISGGSLGLVDLDWSIAGTADFDGGGRADILWRHQVTGHTYIWLLNGAQVISGGSLGLVDLDWSIAGTEG